MSEGGTDQGGRRAKAPMD